MNLLLDSAIKVTIVLAGAMATAALMHRQSAALRHWILAAALVCAAALPLIALVVPSWQVAPAAAAVASRWPDPAARTAKATTRPVATRDAPRRAEPPRPVTRLIGPVWAGGFATTLVFLGIGLARLRRIAARARPVECGPWHEAAQEICREHGMHRSVLMLQSTHPTLLVTWGLRTPRIMLPADAVNWGEDRIRIVLRHELAHIRRCDWPVHLVAEFVTCAYWFNPLVWIVCRRLRQESEQACDDAVLARGVDAPTYARHLLELARIFVAERRACSAAPAMVRSCSLERRIAVILNTRVNRSPIRWSSRLLIAVAAAAITAAVAGGVFAQAGAARFSGSVADPTGAPMPNTTIALTHRETTAGHAMPTDEAGTYDFAALPAGEYTLEARIPGFATVRDTITLSAGESVRRDIRLKLGTIQETITVGAPARPAPARKDPPDFKAILDKFRGQRLQPPIKTKDVRPVYSDALREAGIEGQVVLEGTLATDGAITGIRVASAAHDALVEPARDAVSQWRFEPTRLWGTPVDTAITITINFKPQ